MPPSPPSRRSAGSNPPPDASHRDHSRRGVLAAGASAALAGLAGCLGGDPPSASTAPWPMVGYDAGRTNHRAAASPPLADVSVAWRTQLAPSGRPGGQPLAYGDLVVVPDRGLTALDRSDGSVRFELAERGPSVAVADASGYRTPTLVVGDDGDVAGLDATGGVDAPVGRRIAERWRATDGDSTSFVGGFQEDRTGQTPVAREGVVYHDGGDHALVARDAASGRVRWTVEAPRSNARFAVGEHVYVSEFGFSVRALDPTDGSVVWRYDGDPNRWSSVASAEGVVYANDGRGITALDATDGGARRWQTENVDTDFGIPTVVDDRVLLATFDAVYGFDRETGERVWKRALDVSGLKHVAAAGSLALVPTEAGDLVALDAQSGRTTWQVALPPAWDASPPVVVDGRVFVNLGQELVCLEGSR